MFIMHLSAVAAATVLIASASVPAQNSVTEVTLVVESGALSITAPQTFTVEVEDPNRAISFMQKDISVADLRAGGVGWIAAASVSEPVDNLGNILSTHGATYTAGEASVSGSANVEARGPVTGNLMGSPVQEASNVVGNNTSIWDADVTIPVPPVTTAGTYSVTVTHSVY